MSRDHKHSEQFERYLTGKMTAEEAHAFEREVLDDPFAAEALEGYQAQGAESLRDLEHLQSKIQVKTRKPLPWVRIASAAVLLIVGSFLSYIYLNQLDTSEELVVDEEAMDEQLYTQSPAVDTLIVQKAETDEPEQTGHATADQLTESTNQTNAEFFAKQDDQMTVAAQDKKVENETLPALGDAAGFQMADAAAAKEVDESAYERTFDTNNEQIQTTEIAAAIDVEGDSNLTMARSQLPTEEITISEETQQTDDEIVETVITEDARDQPSEKAKRRARGAVSRSAFIGNEIAGTVTDDSGEPLPGVTVVIKGTSTGTTTDLDGRYELGRQEGMILVFSFVGFDSQEIKVGERNTVDISLGGAVELQEIVVTGYGGETASISYAAAKPQIGTKAFKRYLETNLDYPSSALANEIEGTVTLELTISAGGEITDIQVRKSLGFGCDEEAIRLISEGPSWDPAKRNGVQEEDKARVKVKFKIK